VGASLVAFENGEAQIQVGLILRLFKPLLQTLSLPP
jgi:hypothetical protein